VPLVVAQLLIVGAALAGVAYRASQLESRRALPPLRELPREISPLHDEPAMISDAQLASVLRKLRPRFQGADTKIGNVDHNLRFWGTEATFDEPGYVSGEQMRKVLLDHRAYLDLYKDDPLATLKPLLIDVDRRGARVRDFEGKLSSSHDDHTMACLAEVGTPLDYPVVLPLRATTFREIVEQSLRDFSLNQAEYEWSALTYAVFLKTNRWVTSEGQEVTFDTLADRIMREDLPQGVCMGNHRLHALVMLLRVDEIWDGDSPMLSPAMREKIVAFLAAVTEKLVAHQHEKGFWNVDWPTRKPADEKPTEREGDRLGDRIIATGHTLEWWALVPKKYSDRILPGDRNKLLLAGKWLEQTIMELSDQEVLDNNSFLSHAGRALALWRGKYPHEVPLGPAAKPQEKPAQAEAPQTSTTNS
jgi:hypothetical protein